MNNTNELKPIGIFGNIVIYLFNDKYIVRLGVNKFSEEFNSFNEAYMEFRKEIMK